MANNPANQPLTNTKKGPKGSTAVSKKPQSTRTLYKPGAKALAGQPLPIARKKFGKVNPSGEPKNGQGN